MGLFHRRRFEGLYERFDYAYGKSDVFQSDWFGHYVIYRKFLQEYALTDVPTIDLCCGSGAGTKMIAEHTKALTIGLDYSKEAIEFSRRENHILSLTDYEVLDLNKGLKRLGKIIKDGGIQQVFFIEGIEHLKHPYKVLETLLAHSTIRRVFISTPNEREGTKPEGYHIHPFTPDVYQQYAQKYGFELLCYCKQVTAAEVRQRLNGVDRDQLCNSYFTDDKNEGVSYLIQIQRG